MFWRRVLILCCVAPLLVTGCQRAADTPQISEAGPATGEQPTSRPSEIQVAADVPQGEDILTQVLALNERLSLPSAKFESGHVDQLEFDQDQVKRTETGFVIQLPSKSPVPTPTIRGGRLYVSGGFSSEEYYCFDAQNGKFIWGAQLDDDGPSSCVPYEDSIIFGCESCTLFALDAADGKLRWSHWLGDPLLSAPTLSGGRVYAVYPAVDQGDESLEELPEDDDSDRPAANGDKNTLQATHIVACFDAKSGNVVWRRWIDSDCMSAPVAVNDELYLASLTGTLYQFDAHDGRLRSAERLRATSVPVIVDNSLYVTRRADAGPEDEVSECIVLHNRRTRDVQYVAARQAAPYLDQAVQRQAAFSKDAEAFEAPNGIGGGFGGGFGGGNGGGFGSGQFSLPLDEAEPGTEPTEEQVDPQPTMPLEMPQLSTEPLIITQRQAADTIGLGNVSTLQTYQGSRVLYWNKRLFNCMGNQLICTDADSGKNAWSITIKGDQEKMGGHLASPPVFAGGFLFVATVDGEILQVSPQAGAIVKRFSIGSQMRFSPIIQGAWIYVGTQDGKVVAINTGNPDLTGWPMPGKDPAHSNVIPSDGT